MQPAIEYADSAFVVPSTLLYFRVCLHFGRMPYRLFAKFVAGLATKCPVKEKVWSRKGGFNWTKNDGDAHR